MQMQLIRDLARERGIKSGRLSKINLVREIQRSEGNFSCFATATSGDCDQLDCLWRDDCFAAAKKAAN